MACLLIRGARQLLTLRGPTGPRRGPFLTDLGLIPDGAVLIRNGVILSLGPSRQVQSQAAARDCEEIDAMGRVVMPAFVDLSASLVHAHPAPRSFDILHRHYNNPDPETFRDALHEGARALSTLSAQSFRARADSIAEGMLRHGTGTVESRAPYPLNDTDALKVLRVQRVRSSPIDTVSSLLLALSPGEDPGAWGQRLREHLLPLVRNRRLARFADLKYDPLSIPESLAAAILETARRLGFGIRTHADFFSSAGAVPLAIRTGALSVSGLRNVTPDQISLLAASSTIAILAPGIALQTGPRYCAPGRQLVDAGVIPALCCAYHPELSPGYNMQLMLLLACRLYRFKPEEAIIAATINSAHALGAAASVGSLEAGKQADILILNVSDYREVAYYAGVNVISKVIKNGRVVYDGDQAVGR